MVGCCIPRGPAKSRIRAPDPDTDRTRTGPEWLAKWLPLGNLKNDTANWRDGREKLDCPHCKKTTEWEIVIAEIKKALLVRPATPGLEAAAKGQAERAELIEWLERWRQDC